MLPLLSSCFTGVEGTKKITLSKEDRKILRPSAEDTFFSSIEAAPLSAWQKGKPFYATDNRVSLIFDQQGLPTDPDHIGLGGKVITFEGIEERLGPDGKSYISILFKCGDLMLRYLTGKNRDEAPESINSDALPMLIDLDMIHEASLLMTGKKLYTRTALWYDKDGNRLAGRKFVPVTIREVLPGSMVFPIKTVFEDQDGNKACVLLNFGNSGTESRAFSHIFSLEDIRKKFPGITDEVWDLICREQIRTGMTKDECRLSLGNPTEVSAGHDYSQTLDLWHYPDGTVLWFEDGLLSRFRK